MPESPTSLAVALATRGDLAKEMSFNINFNIAFARMRDAMNEDIKVATSFAARP